MANDPRIKRILKRYRKGEQLSDSSVDVSGMDMKYLLQACRCEDELSLVLPKELDEIAIAYLERRMQLDFAGGEFDYFLHSYVRAEFVSSYYEDPSVTSRPPPEDGPPAKIVAHKGMRWVSVRPKDGQEHYEAWEIAEGGEADDI